MAVLASARGLQSSTVPKSRTQFWAQQLGGNVERDREHIENLSAMGWDVSTVWKCEINAATALAHIIRFLESRPTRPSRDGA